MSRNYLGNWVSYMDTQLLFKALNDIDKLGAQCCPKKSDTFNAFKFCKVEDCYVVMIGYDPYPQKDIATGIMFGNKEDTPEINLSPSLKIIKEAAINFEVPHNSIIFDNSLKSWCKQGVLMLNSSLTTELGKTGAHTNIWRPFVTNFVNQLSNNHTGLVYVLFGDNAQTLLPYINTRLNIVFKEKHPAFYARTNSKMRSTIFENINKYLKVQYNKTIKWYDEDTG